MATGLIEFGNRVRDLREAKKLSQGDLAEQAGMAPAALSRLLSGARPLRMDQAVRLARALGVSVIELTQGTTAGGVVSEWIPRAEFDQADRIRTEAERELALTRSEAEARAREVSTLRESVGSLTSRTGELDRELARCRADAARAEELSGLNGELNRQIHELQADLTSARLEAVAFKTDATKWLDLANQNYSAWQSAVSQLEAVKTNLAKAKSGTITVGVVTAALAGLAGTMLATPAKTSRGRTRG